MFDGLINSRFIKGNERKIYTHPQTHRTNVRIYEKGLDIIRFYLFHSGEREKEKEGEREETID